MTQEVRNILCTRIQPMMGHVVQMSVCSYVELICLTSLKPTMPDIATKLSVASSSYARCWEATDPMATMAGLLIAHGIGVDIAGWRSLWGQLTDGAGRPGLSWL
jgi:hypothetical protein